MCGHSYEDARWRDRRSGFVGWVEKVGVLPYKLFSLIPCRTLLKMPAQINIHVNFDIKNIFVVNSEYSEFANQIYNIGLELTNEFPLLYSMNWIGISPELQKGTAFISRRIREHLNIYGNVDIGQLWSQIFCTSHNIIKCCVI